MITPTPGRIVWFYPDVNDGRAKGPTGPVPLAAIVAKVIHERCVNLSVSNEDGTTFGAQNIVLLQDGFTLADPDRAYAEWMPYQKGQAAKTEQVQTAATTGAPAAPAIDLAPVHEKLSELEKGVEGKFHDLGNWLQSTIGDFHMRLGALEKPPAAPGADLTAEGAAAAAASANAGAGASPNVV